MARTPIFRGEHTSLDAQGYMEGGALSGAAAADEIAAALGLDAALVTARRLAPHAAAQGVPLEAFPALRIARRARALRQERRLRRRGLHVASAGPAGRIR